MLYFTEQSADSLVGSILTSLTFVNNAPFSSAWDSKILFFCHERGRRRLENAEYSTLTY